jgi:hypothetical protein
MLMAISRIRDLSVAFNYDGDIAPREVHDVLYGNGRQLPSRGLIRYEGCDVLLDVQAGTGLGAKAYIIQALTGVARHPDEHGCTLVAVEITTTCVARCE